MLIDTDENALEWHRVEYSVPEVQSLMRDARLPARLVARLAVGL